MVRRLELVVEDARVRRHTRDHAALAGVRADLTALSAELLLIHVEDGLGRRRAVLEQPVMALFAPADRRAPRAAPLLDLALLLELVPRAGPRRRWCP